jgi:peptidoglycan/LPS O-acetylase OafA/YrhL
MSERETYPSLTGLRFVLAAWITVYHLFSLYGAPAIAEHPLIAAGAARVDIFFVLSGFVLAHVYAVRQGARFEFTGFLVARAARLYPLHLMALAILAAAVAMAHLTGRSVEVADYSLQGLLANLAMLQATHIAGAGAWNFPAWTLSAEAFGYLLFPAFLLLGAALRRRPFALVGVSLGLAWALGAIWPVLGMGSLADATQSFGVVRGACCMLVGVSMRFAFEEVVLDRLQAITLAAAGGLMAGVAAMLNFDLWWVAMGAGGLILGIAALDRAGVATPLAAPVMVRLGHWSYALFILHVPVFLIVWRLLGGLGLADSLTIVNGAVMLAISLAVSWPAHALIEDPARTAIRNAYRNRVKKTRETPQTPPPGPALNAAD